MPSSCLPPSPPSLLDPHGEPAWGAYVGPLPPILLGSFARRQGFAAENTRRKRWIYAAIATERILLGMAITDLRYAAHAFLFAAEIGPGGRMLADVSALGVPRVGCQVGDFPEEGCDAWFRSTRASLFFRRPRGSSAYELIAITPELRVYATLDTVGSPAPLAAILRPEGSPLMVTEKRVLMPVRGAFDLHGQRYWLDGAVGGMDYSQGYPPRETTWRWGFFLGKSVDGHPLAMNLVQGFNGYPECVVWFDGCSFPLGEGRFSFHETNPLDPWSIQTDDGAASLSFEPCALHQEAHDLGPIATRFLQPIGVYRGHFDIPGRGRVLVDGAPGVAEDQYVRW
ncbi:MAG: DUF2804 domain-containing protein [Myxococcales bacterium]|nr:DUF2804 domain-containing protein [Polyangiaceae bacterium]MDW8251182.1 DUF2804 domain-containing protein [Myxococcales bacterium]